MKIRITQLDGKLPNLALMKLAHWHRALGDEITFTRRARRDMFEGSYDRVYASAIFTWSAPTIAAFMQDFPEAIIGGSGLNWRVPDSITVEQYLGRDYEHYDYTDYPDFTGSIGFTARGCRFKCGFCDVPIKEGKPRAINSIRDIWRSEPHPKHLHLLDNDFFGQPREQWEARVQEMRDGGFKVCFNQGINVRMIDDQTAAVLATLEYYDDSFHSRRIYTAFDNFKDETRFRRGLDALLAAGIKPDHVLVYMLVGYDPLETWERIFHRFDLLVKLGVRPFPMVFNNARKDLKLFQKWAVRRYYHIVGWDDFAAQHGHIEGLHFEAKRIAALDPTFLDL